ncbi:MAG: hypothetical protein COA92_00460 [Sulfurovum sp.]|nr:MAG: hypothetical protein COA92_00460 [Sulfurovum sp.]
MATQPRKKSTKLSSNKKSIKSSGFKKNIFIILGVFTVITLVTFGYFLGYKEGSEHSRQDKTLNDLSQLKTKKPNDEIRKNLNKRLEPTYTKVKQSVPLEKEQTTKLDYVVQKDVFKVQNTLLAYRGKKPKLAIIIDDVHNKEQIKAIKNLRMKITPSIFPPYALSKYSHLLAKEVKYYMIHIPMESSNKQFNTQEKTLMTSFSDSQIHARVKELRQLFPDAIYINNHTGSTYTQNYTAMKKLYHSLRKEGFIFIDSYTIASSKVRKIAHEFGDAYVSRDIFIDNEHTVASIHEQLKKAVVIAKKKGYALAIGHPHKITMKALERAKDILKNVELVYINEIYR